MRVEKDLSNHNICDIQPHMKTMKSSFGRGAVGEDPGVTTYSSLVTTTIMCHLDNFVIIVEQ